jgi:hypothetical protein
MQSPHPRSAKARSKAIDLAGKQTDDQINEAVRAVNGAGGQPDTDESAIQELAALPMLAYQRRRTESAKQLGIKVGALDKLIRDAREKAGDLEAALPHWNVEPSHEPVDWRLQGRGRDARPDRQDISFGYCVGTQKGAIGCYYGGG